ncbi:MAG: SAM-dependent methyltransferase [Longimicrobiales bacterium]
MILRTGLNLAEKGFLPLTILRLGVRSLIRKRLKEINTDDGDTFLGTIKSGPIAVHTDKANEQHYEIPADFFRHVLGKHLKYSACYWSEQTESLSEAEKSSLEIICERARLRDGQNILELGCGWGSLSLFMADKYPNSQITSVSNSRSQRDFINSKNKQNIEVITADINDFTPDSNFDRVVTIEMLEHVRNHQQLLKRIASWMVPDGLLFIHVFCHRRKLYPFDTDGPHNWMGRLFFSGGMMPSYNYLPSHSDSLKNEQQWWIEGIHYQRTAEAWRLNLESKKPTILELFGDIYGDESSVWYQRWRLFFLACEEMFGYNQGSEWGVGHYLFSPKPFESS